MRTTLTLDPDVAMLLERETHRARKSFKQVVNDALRSALGSKRAGKAKPYVLVAQRSGLAAGVDPGALNRLADELEDDANLTRRR